MTRSTSGTRRWWTLALRALVSIAILVVVASTHDWSTGLDRALELPKWIALAGIGTIIVRNALLALRWRMLLHGLGARLGYRWAHAAIYMAESAALVLPTAIGGDAVRGWLGTRAGVGSERAIAAVLFDRVVGLFTMVLILGTMVVLSWSTLAAAIEVRTSWLAVIPVVGLVVALILWRSRRLRSFLARRAQNAGVEQFFARGRRVGIRLSSAALIGAAGQLCAVAAIVIFTRALGYDTPIPVVGVITLVAWLATLAPISLGGFGVREAALAGGLTQVGVGSADALAIALLWDVVFIAQVLVGAVLVFTIRPKPTPEMVAATGAEGTRL